MDGSDIPHRARRTVCVPGPMVLSFYRRPSTEGVPVELRNALSNRTRLGIECLEQRDTPSTLVVGLGDGAHAAATLTLETGAGASGAIVGHAAPQSGVGGTIVLGTANQ
jgi:hypothetical protein